MTTIDETSAPTAWYRKTTDETAQLLDVDTVGGLTASQVSERQTRYGANELTGKAKETPLHAFLRQYEDLMQIILVGAAVVNQIVTGEAGTTLVLLGLTVFNAVLGLHQEAKAEASLAALEKMLKDIARVRRGGTVSEIDAALFEDGENPVDLAALASPANSDELAARVSAASSADAASSLSRSIATHPSEVATRASVTAR